MPTDNTVKLSFRLDPHVLEALRLLAEEGGYESATAFILELLNRTAAASGKMPEESAIAILRAAELTGAFTAIAQRRHEEGKFTEHFILDVFVEAMDDPALRELYEAHVGGDANATRLAGKWPINPSLGQQIKNAIGAEVQFGSDGKPRRTTVRNRPIQSYTLLRLPATEPVPIAE